MAIGVLLVESRKPERCRRSYDVTLSESILKISRDWDLT